MKVLTENSPLKCKPKKGWPMIQNFGKKNYLQMRERERERSGQIDSIWWNVQTQFRILVYVKRQVRATVNLDYHAKHQLITRETQCSILHPWIFFILRRKLAAYFTLESSSHSLMHLFYQLHLNDCFTTNVHVMMSGTETTWTSDLLFICIQFSYIHISWT